MIEVGTLVTAQGVTGETIIGLVVAPTEAGHWKVVWLSSTRGIFSCEEYHRDLTPCGARERHSISDTRLDHYAVAILLEKVVIETEYENMVAERQYRHDKWADETYP